jgi:hypothetical protein
MVASKHSSVRARRNKTSTHATLTVDHDVEAPPLPGDRVWHPQTVEWWADVWASPMAPEYDASDRHGLFVLAVLVDGFWHKPHWTAAAEIRLQRQCFGLTPMDRRRLQWEIDRGEAAAERTRSRRPDPEKKPDLHAVPDPRALLA